MKVRSPSPHLHTVLAARSDPPAEVLAERSVAYANEEPRTITQELFGDPLPGRSALDARVRILMQG